MPRIEIAPPIARPRHSAPVAGVDRAERRVGEGRVEELEEHVADAGDLDQAGEQRAEPEHRHRHPHRLRLLGDVVVGAGEADLGVLLLFGRRVDRRPVEQLAALDQVLGLRAGVAGQHPEDQPEGVDRGEEGADVAADRHPVVHPAARLGVGEDRVLGEEARGEREGGERQAADQEEHRGEAHRLPEAAHPVDVLAVRHRRDDRAGRHEEQRLEEGVGHQVEEPLRVGADRDAHDHVADLAHRRVGDRPLQVGLGDRDRPRHQQRRQADEGGDVGRGRRQHEEDVGAGDQVDAGGHHRRRVDQRGDRGRALHRVGQPGVEGQLRRLGEGADQQQQADRGHRPLVGAGTPAAPWRRRRRSRRCRVRGRSGRRRGRGRCRRRR